MLRRFGTTVIAALSACGGEQLAELETESRSSLQTAYTCAAGCGGQLGSAVLPGPHGPVTLVAWSNSPQLGTDVDCDPTACAGGSPVTARNGHPAYGCPWQCVELVNRYFQGTWGAPKISADAGAGFCSFAASSSLPQYWVYGQSGASTAGHAPMAGDVLVWAGHVAIASNSVSSGATGTIDLIEQNATCSGTDTVSWDGSMFGAKYGLGALCWVHVLANTGATGPVCPTGSNWHLAGKYCGSEAGMQHADANTLYSCNAAGAAANAVQVCSLGCQQMPAGQDDRCASPSANGGSCTAGNQCQSGNCISGVCCNSACGACGSCGTGTCTPLAAHSTGSPACSGDLLCSGSSASCPASCATSADCAGGTVCSGSACVPPVADAGVVIDGGTDADADAGVNPIATDAGTTAARSDPPPDASSAGCSSGGATWLALLGVAASRRRRRAGSPAISATARRPRARSRAASPGCR